MKKLFTLCLVYKDDSVLLGMKKRGFGMGKWNGFGGKVGGGESIEDAAKRELLEESGLTANIIEKMGVVEFSWKDKPENILEVHYFKSNDFSGDLIESDEMAPKWFSLKDVPFEKMWPDDKHWFPLFLQEKKFEGRFLYDNDNNVVEYELREQGIAEI